MYTVIFLATDYFIAHILIGIQFLNRRVNFILCVDRKEQITRRTVSLLEIAQNNPCISELKHVEDENSGFTTNIPIKKLYFYPNIMHNMVALFKHLTFPPYTRFSAVIMTIISSLIYTYLKPYLYSGRHVLSARFDHEVVAIQQLKMFLYNFSASQNKVSIGSVNNNATRIPIFQITDTGDKNTDIFERLILRIDQAKTGSILKKRTGVPELSFVVPDEEILLTPPTNQ